MNILILAEHVTTDPDRAVFYNADDKHHYIKRGIKKYIQCKGRGVYFFNLLLTVIALRCSWRKYQLDFIVSDNPRIALFVGFVNRLTCCRIEHVVWNFNVLSEYTGLKRLFSRFALKHVRNIVVYSNHEAALYGRVFNIPTERITVKLYSGPYLDDPRYQNLQDRPEDMIVSAGFSGRDYPFLARVAAELPDIPFRVLAYPAALAGVDLPANVEVVSGISEIEYCRHIANARLFFLPIKNKTTANGHIGIVQAMCFKTPLLTNMTDGTSDYLRPDQNAVVFPDGDVPAAVQCIKDYWSNREKANQIALQAYEFATKHFNVQQDVDALEQIIQVNTAKSKTC